MDPAVIGVFIPILAIGPADPVRSVVVMPALPPPLGATNASAEPYWL